MDPVEWGNVRERMASGEPILTKESAHGTIPSERIDIFFLKVLPCSTTTKEQTSETRDMELLNALSHRKVKVAAVLAHKFENYHFIILFLVYHK